MSVRSNLRAAFEYVCRLFPSFQWKLMSPELVAVEGLDPYFEWEGLYVTWDDGKWFILSTRKI